MREEPNTHETDNLRREWLNTQERVISPDVSLKHKIQTIQEFFTWCYRVLILSNMPLPIPHDKLLLNEIILTCVGWLSEENIKKINTSNHETPHDIFKPQCDTAILRVLVRITEAPDIYLREVAPPLFSFFIERLIQLSESKNLCFGDYETKDGVHLLLCEKALLRLTKIFGLQAFEEKIAHIIAPLIERIRDPESNDFHAITVLGVLTFLAPKMFKLREAVPCILNFLENSDVTGDDDWGLEPEYVTYNKINSVKMLTAIVRVPGVDHNQVAELLIKHMEHTLRYDDSFERCGSDIVIALKMIMQCPGIKIEKIVLSLLSLLKHECSDVRACVASILDFLNQTFEHSNDIQVFLNYKPGRSGISIREQCSRINFLDEKMTSGKALDSLSLTIKDKENTSSEESSDDIQDNIQIVNHHLFQVQGVRLARGVHYSPKWFEAAKDRRATQQVSYHQKDIYSPETQALGKTMGLRQADERVKNYFQQLRKTADKKETVRKCKSSFTFNSLYYRFIHAYVLSYNKIFSGNSLQIDFDYSVNSFQKPQNPLISTSKSFLVAANYATGRWLSKKTKEHYCTQFFPKVRKSNGSLKYRRLGYIQIYVIPHNYQECTDVKRLHDEGRIFLSCRYQGGEEVIIESSIPASYVLGYQIFSLPKMNEPWSCQVHQQYGLLKHQYDNFQSRLRGDKGTEEIKEILKELIEQVIKQQVARLQQQLVSNDIDGLGAQMTSFNI